MTSFQIRPATPEDAEAILIAHHAAIRAKAASFYPADVIEAWTYPITPEKIKLQYEELQDTELICLVAEHSTGVFGFAMAIPSQEELRAVYVAPNPYPKIGSSLLQKIEKLCIEKGCKKLEMDASINAEAFYNQHGYLSLEKSFHTFQSGKSMQCVKMVKQLIR